MKKPDSNAVEQMEVDQEAAQLVCLDPGILSFVQLDNGADDEERRRKEEEGKTLQKLFAKCKFFIGREVPREMFAFAIR